MKKLFLIAILALLASCIQTVTVKTEKGKIFSIKDPMEYSLFCKDVIIYNSSVNSEWKIYSCNENDISNLDTFFIAKNGDTIYVYYEQAKIFSVKY